MCSLLQPGQGFRLELEVLQLEVRVLQFEALQFPAVDTAAAVTSARPDIPAGSCRCCRTDRYGKPGAQHAAQVHAELQPAAVEFLALLSEFVVSAAPLVASAVSRLPRTAAHSGGMCLIQSHRRSLLRDSEAMASAASPIARASTGNADRMASATDRPWQPLFHSAG